MINERIVVEKLKIAVAALATSVLAVAPLAAASAAPKPHAKFEVSKLVIVGHTKSYDVAKGDAIVRARIQVKDHDKKFDPASVVLIVTEKTTGLPATLTTVHGRLVSHSKVVSNWHANITVAKGSVAPGVTARYCISLVKVADGTAVTPVKVSAKGLVGRDCFNVTNTATV